MRTQLVRERVGMALTLVYTDRYITHMSRENRERIMHVALNLFSSRGYEGTGVQDVVNACGITKPTLYHYFGSKRGLLLAILERYGNARRENLEHVFRYQGDITRTLTETAVELFRFADRHPAFYRLLLGLWLAPVASDGFRAGASYHEELQGRLETLFVEAAADHGNMKGRHREYAATYLGMLHTYIGLAQNGYVKLGRTVAFRAVRQFMHGIFS